MAVSAEFPAADPSATDWAMDGDDLRVVGGAASRGLTSSRAAALVHPDLPPIKAAHGVGPVCQERFPRRPFPHLDQSQLGNVDGLLPECPEFVPE